MSVKASKRLSVAASPGAAVATLQRLDASTILITNRHRVKKINSRSLRQIVQMLLAELEISRAELGITLVNAKEMARINWQFLRHEGSTDVITFDHAEMRKAKSEKRNTLHGELFICVDDAVAQARQFKTSWQSEVVRYLVHGLLHLLGYDDLRADLRRKMKREENRLLRRLQKRFSFTQL